MKRETKSTSRGRRLHGRRGLKLSSQERGVRSIWSPPSRAAWIEMVKKGEKAVSKFRRRLHGRRGLKSNSTKTEIVMTANRRRLHGRRGLKSQGAIAYGGAKSSPPSRAAWIEIVKTLACRFIRQPRRRLHGRRGLKYAADICRNGGFGRRLHGRRGLKYRLRQDRKSGTGRRLHGRRGLKSYMRWIPLRSYRSPPSRAAWIEMKLVRTSSAVPIGRRLHGRRGLKSRPCSG